MDIEVLAQFAGVDGEALLALAWAILAKTTLAMAFWELVKATWRRVRPNSRIAPNVSRVACWVLSVALTVPELMEATPVLAASAVAAAFFLGGKLHDKLTSQRPEANTTPEPSEAVVAEVERAIIAAQRSAAYSGDDVKDLRVSEIPDYTRTRRRGE